MSYATGTCAHCGRIVPKNSMRQISHKIQSGETKRYNGRNTHYVASTSKHYRNKTVWVCAACYRSYARTNRFWLLLLIAVFGVIYFLATHPQNISKADKALNDRYAKMKEIDREAIQNRGHH